MVDVLPIAEDRIRRTLDHLRSETTDEFELVAEVDPKEFLDAGIARLERELVFGRVPSIACHASELPEPGDFVTLRMPRNDVLVVRQPDGGLRSFVNACGYRGESLEAEPSGTREMFCCRQHGLFYALDGRLRATTNVAGDSEPDTHAGRLVEIPTEQRHGLVWIVDNAAADIDVSAWLGAEVDAMMAGYHLDALVAVQVGGFDEPVNWKIMQDAFIDNYHIQYAHPNSAAKHVHTNVQTVEDFGRHARMQTPRKTIDRWLEEDPSDQSLSGHVIDGHFLLPNSTMLRQPDHFELLTFRPHPVDPGCSHMDMRLLVPTVADSRLDRDRWQRLWDKNWRILMTVLHEEDIPLLRDSQRGIASADAGTLLLGRNEVVNQIFRRELDKLLTINV